MFPEQQYNVLFESGELFELFPNAIGIWEEDEYFFTVYFEQNKEAIEDFDFTVNLDNEL